MSDLLGAFNILCGHNIDLNMILLCLLCSRTSLLTRPVELITNSLGIYSSLWCTNIQRHLIICYKL